MSDPTEPTEPEGLEGVTDPPGTHTRDLGPYGRPSDPAKRISATITDGPDRAGARSMLKAIGFTDEDLAKPIIAVATQWTETMPCNFNQRDLALHVKDGIRAAGGTPMEFNTISISDGVTMGTEGMKASLVSRELIADSIELVARGHLFDGIVCLVGCDKTLPAAAMALGRLDIPGVILYNGTIMPGSFQGRDVTIQSVFEAVGAYQAGRITAEELWALEEVACPGPGACGGQFTANTMSTAMEFIGLSPAGLNGIPAIDPAKSEAARRTGELVMKLVREDTRPSSIVTRRARRTRSPRSPRPAARRTASCTCWRSPASSTSRSRSTSSAPSPTAPPCWPTWSPAAGSRRTTPMSRAVSGS